MFMFPEPPPIDYRIIDVTPSYLSDGIFHRGNPAPTHKFVAIQLKPIKRTRSDPVAPPEQIDSRKLDQLMRKQREGFVAPCGFDDGKIYETYTWMPKWKRDGVGTKTSHFAIFPRSPQYELWHIQNRRLKNFERYNVPTVECSKMERPSGDKTNEDPCGSLRAPFWWRDEIKELKKLPMGNVNDYAYESLKESGVMDVKISKRLEMDHPKKYIPGAIHRIENPDDTSMQDVLDRADSFKVVLKRDETLTEERPPMHQCDCPKTCYMKQARCDSKWDQDVRAADKTPFESDTRWKPVYDSIGFPGTDLERQAELRRLTKPFLHDLHAWYTRNKPAKMVLPVENAGKKLFPAKQVSHL